MEWYSAEIRVDGRRRTYYVSDYGERAGVLVLRDGKALLVSQFRFLLGRRAWEIPGGKVETGESPVAAAARECAEEAGVRFRSPRKLLTYMPGTDVQSNRTHVFVARWAADLPRPRGTEIRGVRWVPLSRCLDWLRRGRIQDGLTVIALLAYAGRRAVREGGP